MFKLFQRFTKHLSIKTIVILGVIIMAIIIAAFGFTMSYLSSTIKYDQNTIRYLLDLEKHNQNVLKNIKDINELNNKILLSKNSYDLHKLESKLVSNIVFNIKIEQIIKNSSSIDEYNSKAKLLKEKLNSLISNQERIYELKNISIFYLEELQEYKNSIDESIEKVSNEAEGIYGKASLYTKRYNRKIKNNTFDLKDSSELLNLSKIMSLSKDLDSSILKLPKFIYDINTTSNIDLVNSVQRNNLRQLNSLLISTLNAFDNIKIDLDLKKSLENIKEQFILIEELITFIINSKKQLLQQEELLRTLNLENTNLQNEIFLDFNSLDSTANKIKLNILNHSDSISKTSTYIILIVGFICLLLLSLAATTLISRINLPLEFLVKYIDSIINKKRSLSSKLPIVSDDEFAKLSKSFNVMTSTISENIKEIHHLYKEIEDTQKEVIFTMGAIGESRSKETGNHVKRVAEYSKILAIKAGLEKKEAELLKEASPMHDIGKVGIPDEVLKKPGKLYGQEWEIMKTHANLGYEMLKHSNREILKAAAIVAREHHEKWDGSGYPRALKGEQIHIYGRITAVADVFDALGSDRCYKKAWPLNDILAFFKENSGSHFDPNLVEIFLENLDEFLYVRDKYKDIF